MTPLNTHVKNYRRRKMHSLFLVVLLLLPVLTKGQVKFQEDLKELFIEVQTKSVFEDSKTFPDCTPLYSVDEILTEYQKAKDSTGFELKKFVLANFKPPATPASGFQSNPTNTVIEHINALWPVLTRQPDSVRGSLIPLPYPYVVPGGRFREIYYWDSYFTMLGLKASGQNQLIRNMVDNFAYLINTVGFIPNGNRTYYLSRSQPPFFALMVDLLASIEGDTVLIKYLPVLEKEYAFWMDGKESLKGVNFSFRRVVRMQGEEILNRYWDDSTTPRTESYREDVELAKSSGRREEEVYRNIKAACESGWDFSSRWFKDGKTLKTIHTTEIIPVDLNSLLYNLELTIAKAYKVKANNSLSVQYVSLAEKRKKALLKYCWDPKTKYFYDYDFESQRRKSVKSLAASYPLFFGIADDAHAKAVAKVLEEKFLFSGGLTTTPTRTKQQWDYPNGWAPLQYISIKGLEKYNLNPLAQKIRNNWISNNLRVYKNTGKMVEKYNVEDISLLAGGGEYSLQDGFGWSNGVLISLMTEGD